MLVGNPETSSGAPGSVATDPGQIGAAVAPLVDGTRLRMARELREMTQEELVSAAGRTFTAAALSQIEQGHTRPSPATLLAVADATRCRPEFFMRRPGDRPGPGYFRTPRSASLEPSTSATAKLRRRAQARARLLHDLIDALEEHLLLPELDLPHIPVEVGDLQGVENAAAEVRHRWGVGTGPIPDVVRLLERKGMVVVRVDEFGSDIDAFSIFFPDRPIIVLGAKKGVTARSRFDAAHELGHQVMHQGLKADSPALEEQAEQFAAAFLMPSDSIKAHLPATADWAQLMELKAYWRVSMQALVRRALTLDVTDEQQYRNARKAIGARGWLREEPGDDLLGPLEEPILLDAIKQQLGAMGLSIAQVAAEASLPVHDIEIILDRTRRQRPSVEI